MIRRQSGHCRSAHRCRASPRKVSTRPRRQRRRSTSVLAAFDARGAAAIMAPGEGDVFRRYASLWLPRVEQALSSARADGLSASVSGVEFDTSGRRRATAADPDRVRRERHLAVRLEQRCDSAGERNPDWPTTRVRHHRRRRVAGAGRRRHAGDPRRTRHRHHTGRPRHPGALQQWRRATTRRGRWTAPRSCPSTTTSAPPTARDPFTLSLADGCITATGTFASGFADAADQRSRRSTTTRCGRAARTAWSAARSPGWRSSAPPACRKLPSVGVVEHDGSWFVSPIHTIAASVIEPLRDLPDDVNAIDIPLFA